MKKVLTFFDIFLIGLGYIIGAGMYSLIYLTTKYGREFTWLSFIVGGLISLMTGLSYADLSKHFDTTASDYDYITEGLSQKYKITAGTLVVGVGILTISCLSLAFSNITKKMFNKLPYALILILSIATPALINIFDVKTTSYVNTAISATEILTLFVLVIATFLKIGLNGSSNKTIQKFTNFSKVNYKDMIKNNFDFKHFDIGKMFHGAFLTIIAFSGFEVLPKLAEETIDSRENIPKAIIWSIIFVIILYALISISLNTVLGHRHVSDNINPITIAFKELFGANTEGLINIITLTSIMGGILLTILLTSRQLYGVSQRKVFPKIFAEINERTKTPVNSTIIVSLISLLICFIINIDTTNHLINLLLFIIFFLINLANIKMNYDGKMKENIANKNGEKKGLKAIPIYSVIGVISSGLIIIKSLKDSFLK